MVGALRDSSVGKAVMAGIVFAIIAVFVLEFRTTSGMETGSLKRECAVRIDGECVTIKDYQAEYGLVVPRGIPAKQVKALSLRKHVLEGVIERELLFAEARRLGLLVDDEAVKAELRLGRAHVSLPATEALRLGSMLDLVAADESGISRDLVRELPIVDPKTKEVDDDLYARVVRSMTGRSPKEFLKMQQRELLAARLRDVVRAPVRISAEEAFDAFARDKSRAVVRTVRLDSEWFTRWSVDTSDAAVDRWAGENKAPVDEAWKIEGPKWKADCVLASEIFLSLEADASEAEKTLLKEKIERARTGIAEGLPFDVAARQLSEGPTGFVGGFIGCLTAEAYGEEGDVLSKAVLGLPVGAVSDILQTKRGYHLVRAHGRLAAGEVETVGRRSVARSLAVRALAEVRLRDFATRATQAVKGGARLDDTVQGLVPEFAKAALDLARGVAPKASKGEEEAPAEDPPPLSDRRVPKAEVSAPFSLDGEPVPGLFGGPSLARIAFDLPTVDDIHPEPIPVAGGVVLLQLKEKTVATREEFAESKAEITKRLEVTKRADALARYVARLRQAKQSKIEVNERILEEPKSADTE